MTHIYVIFQKQCLECDTHIVKCICCDYLYVFV